MLSQANSIVDDVKDASCERKKKTTVMIEESLPRSIVAGLIITSNELLVHAPRSVRSLYKQNTNMRKRRTCLRKCSTVTKVYVGIEGSREEYKCW